MSPNHETFSLEGNFLEQKLESAGVTPELERRLKKFGFIFHFLSQQDLTPQIPTWTPPLSPWLKIHIEEEETVDPKVLFLPQALIAIETRAKPPFENGQQMYPRDEEFLGPVLKSLREEEKIPREVEYGLGTLNLPPDSRFGLSFEEIKNHIIPQLSQILDVEKKRIHLPKISQFLYLAYHFYPQLLSKGTIEWCEDLYFSARTKEVIGRLFVGDTEPGERNLIYWRGPGGRLPSLGFRLVVSFS